MYQDFISRLKAARRKVVAVLAVVALGSGVALAGGPAAVGAALVSRTGLAADVKFDLDTTKQYGASSSADVVIHDISGSIFTDGRATVVPGIDLTGFSGIFQVTVSGQVDRTLAAVTPGKAIQPQFTVWVDCDGDGKFENGEGIMSPNATIPDQKNRSVTINGVAAKVKVWKACRIKLLAFGYASDGSPYGEPTTPELTVAKGASLVLEATR